VDEVRRKFGGKAVTRMELLGFKKKPTNSAD
jgi:hypothetical protein